MLSFNVKAFGVSSPYWDENPLFVKPGETKEVTMILQNMVGSEDLIMIAELKGGKEIAIITDPSTTYNVPLGINNVPVHLRINIPEDAKPSQSWNIGVSFTTVTPATGGVGLAGAIVKGFPVKVIEEAKPTIIPKVSEGLTGFIILIIILVILMLIIKYIYKGKENKNVK